MIKIDTKRTIDLAVTVPVVLLTLPLMVLVAIVIKLSSKGPVFYTQERIGLNGRPFKMWKFRSMVVGAEHMIDDRLKDEWSRCFKLNHDPRVTTLGRVLRKTSIDELPQLWNVLKGDISLVGPRPLPAYHLDGLPDDFVACRNQVLPGVTGVWQVCSRSQGDLVECDKHYIDNRSVVLDLKVLIMTPLSVFTCRGAV